MSLVGAGLATTTERVGVGNPTLEVRPIKIANHRREVLADGGRPRRKRDFDRDAAVARILSVYRGKLIDDTAGKSGE